MSVYTVRLNHISQQPEGCTIRLHEKKRLENEFNQHFYKYHFGNRHNRLLLLMRSGNFLSPFVQLDSSKPAKSLFSG